MAASPYPAYVMVRPSQTASDYAAA